MKNFEINTGRDIIKFNVPEGATYEVLLPNEYPVLNNLVQEIRKALDSPISAEPLTNLVKPGQKVALIINDNTRYVPQDVIVPEILKRLADSGIARDEITIVIATGTHRPNAKDEIIEMIGKEIPQKYRIINHNAYDEAGLVRLGMSEKLPVPIVLNKTVVEADIRIGIGVIEPHLFAGYSGGVKILAVGTAGIDTIAATHNARMLEHPTVKFGIVKNNAFRGFLNEVADVAGLHFIVNVVQNGDKKVLGVFAGDPVIAYEKGVQFAERVYTVKATKQADIVISVPKYPKTINLYQATRAANSIVFGEKPLVKKGGVLIIPARCWDGLGSEELYKDLSETEDTEEIIRRAREKGFPPEGHKAFSISRMLQHCDIYITDTDIDENVLKKMHLEYAQDISEVLGKACGGELQGKHIAILPDGCITIPKII